MISMERLYLTADRKHVVQHGDDRAAFLLVGAGCVLPDPIARQYGLLARDPHRFTVSQATLDTAPIEAHSQAPADPPATKVIQAPMSGSLLVIGRNESEPQSSAPVPAPDDSDLMESVLSEGHATGNLPGHEPTAGPAPVDEPAPADQAPAKAPKPSRAAK